jgi:hypothetical protein
MRKTVRVRDVIYLKAFSWAFITGLCVCVCVLVCVVYCASIELLELALLSASLTQTHDDFIRLCILLVG